MKQDFNTPILFIVFNRPNTTKQVFETIRAIKPTKLYVAADGPRENNDNDVVKCKEVREIATQIDWDCELHTLFSEDNLGLKAAEIRAFTWLFENEEYGIILEDDTLPDMSFFHFQQELLQKYKDDERIGLIAGRNILRSIHSNHSYCFSKHIATWGWGSWKRVWENYDVNMSFRNTEDERNILSNKGLYNKELGIGKYQINLLEKYNANTWDYQFGFSIAANNQLCIFPKTNLINNLGSGLGGGATNTLIVKNIQTSSLNFPLVHPKYIVPDYHFDVKFLKKTNRFSTKVKRLFPVSIKNVVKKLILVIYRYLR